MKREINTSEGNSNYIGNLPFGCILCMRGQKMVLFMGGKCYNPKRCNWYCPISNERKNKDQIYANEIAITHPDEVISEVKKTKALGCSLTGGDPLGNEDNIEVSLFYIEELKEVFSDDFHIHLYTTGKNFTLELAKDLAEAGLDEIRFHPAEEDFHRIQYAIDAGITVGAEVPVIPTKENEEYLWNLIDYIDTIGADFINLNEFEINGPNCIELNRRGFQLREDTMAAVVGSEELALKMLKNFPERYTLNAHFCPISLKDGPQLRNRYKRRAETIRKPYEEITKDGTLVFLRVYGHQIKLSKFLDEILFDSRVPVKMTYLYHDQVNESNDYLDLPWFLSEERRFKRTLKKYKLKAGIMEVLPFRGKYADLCEYSPIN